MDNTVVVLTNGQEFRLTGRSAAMVQAIVGAAESLNVPAKTKIEFNCAGRSVSMRVIYYHEIKTQTARKVDGDGK